VSSKSVDRRSFIKILSGLGLLAGWSAQRVEAENLAAIHKVIPSSGEKLPVIGMGSSRTFDAGLDPGERANLLEVLRVFFEQGGALIDSSPMYGTSEQVIGDLLKQLGTQPEWFAATKVWTWGRQSGIDQMQQSMRRMGVKVFDLMQIHNLRDWQVHLETLLQWKAEGKLRYIGITTSHGRFHDQLETILASESLDFVQFSYNIADRKAEQRLLPLAAEHRIATIVNRPFQRGALFRTVRGKSLPDWAAEFDCHSWGQYFLKFAVSHPAVTIVIPATSKVHHMIDNMRAGFGRLPDAAMRKRMVGHMRKV